MRCSAAQIEDIATGSFWKDVLDFLDEEEHNIISELSKSSWNHSTGEQELDFNTRLMHDENLRGALRLLGIVKRLPEYLAAQAEEEQENREREE